MIKKKTKYNLTMMSLNEFIHSRCEVCVFSGSCPYVVSLDCKNAIKIRYVEIMNRTNFNDDVVRGL